MDQQRYFEWLCSKVKADREPEYMHYHCLLSDLFNQEYRWDFAMESDANRADDGINLRRLYFQESGDKITWADRKFSCTILEMLIAMSIRIEMDIMGNPGEDRPERWFWEMLGNLGLMTMTDNNYNPDYVAEVIHKWMARQYGKNGNGGIFPLKKPASDQRAVPIWEQMGAYLVERY